MAFEENYEYRNNITASHLVLHPSIIAVKDRFMAIIEASETAQKFVIVDHIYNLLLEGSTGQINSALGGYSRGSKEATLAWYVELGNYLRENRERFVKSSVVSQEVQPLRLPTKVGKNLKNYFHSLTENNRIMGEILQVSTLYMLPVATFGRDHHWTLSRLEIPTLEIHVACLPLLKALAFHKKKLIRRLKDNGKTAAMLGKLFLFIGVVIVGDQTSSILLPSIEEQFSQYKEYLSKLTKVGVRLGIAVIERNGVPW